MRILLVIFFTCINIYACALCTMTTPAVWISNKITTDETSIKNIHFRWSFTQEFTKYVASTHDKNQNKIFEKDEIAAIKKALVDYISKKNYLTNIKYNPNDSDVPIQKIPNLKLESVENLKIEFENNSLTVYYDVPVNFKLAIGDVLFIEVHDDEGFFAFKYEANFIHIINNSEFELIENTRGYVAFIEVKDKQVGEIQVPIHGEIPEEVTVEEETGFLSKILKNVSDTVQNYIVMIKDTGSFMAFFMLLIFSFGYGFLHAAGPGHGKSIVASYIISTNKNVKKAFAISMLIGVVHTFSAFLLTLVIYFFLNVLLAPFIDDVSFWVTKVSALIIIGIALYLIYKKIPKKQKTMTWSTHQPSCGCSACKLDSNTTDLGIILSAGIVPCPGTVVIFILTLSQGMYMVGFASAIFMSLGMSLTIFLTALLSIAIRKGASTNETLIEFFEYLSLAIIFSLGVALLVF